MKLNIKLSFLALLGILFLSACSSPGTSYNTSGSEKVSASFGITDQRNMVNDLVNQILNDPTLQTLSGGSRPVLLVSDIKNKSSEHIDTESITDSIKSAIIKRQLFSVVNRNKMDIIQQENQLVASGLTDSATAIQLGKLWGARYAMYGNFSSIEEWVDKNTRQNYYKLTIVIMDIQTSQEVWSAESELSKTTKK